MRALLPTIPVLSLLLLAGCASDPPRMIALPAPPGAAPVAGTPASLLLRPVSVPGYLDGLDVVTDRRGGEVVIDRNTEWAERLSDGVTRVLSAALADRLGTANMLIEGDGRVPDADLSVVITAMDPESGKLVLAARWTLVGSRGERLVRTGQERIEVPLRAGDADGIAEASSRALAHLADRIAAAAVGFERRLP